MTKKAKNYTGTDVKGSDAGNNAPLWKDYVLRGMSIPVEDIVTMRPYNREEMLTYRKRHALTWTAFGDRVGLLQRSIIREVSEHGVLSNCRSSLLCALEQLKMFRDENKRLRSENDRLRGLGNDMGGYLSQKDEVQGVIV